MRYELYYWPGIQGRGELVRLALEDAGAGYVNKPPEARYKAFAPPYLKAAKRPGISRYLSSGRRIAFNQHGIFRHYPELDR